MKGQLMLKYLNQRCIIQYIGFEYILIYSQDLARAYILRTKDMMQISDVSVKNVHLLSMSDSKVA